MKLPPDIEELVNRTLAERGLPGLTGVDAVGGGCISPAARVRAGDHQYFLKWATPRTPHRMFECEAYALRIIRDTSTVTTPIVMEARPEFLLLEWLPSARAGAAEWQTFGQQLAHLHEVREQAFGWPESNYIGSLPQSNQRTTSWPAFWRDQRLRPQLELAMRAGELNKADRDEFERLFEQLTTLLAPAQEEGASLLHGDLWSGNVHAFEGGIAVIDPATYFGHREVDLAMAALFGGFPADFWQGYNTVWRLEAGADRRRAVYQLYYLLVHVNLFGGGYAQQTRAALKRALTP